MELASEMYPDHPLIHGKIEGPSLFITFAAMTPEAIS
jgi:hypothetical protein